MHAYSKYFCYLNYIHAYSRYFCYLNTHTHTHTRTHTHTHTHTDIYIYIYIFCEVFGYLNIYIFFCDPNSCLGHPFGFTTYWVRNFDLPLGLLEAHPRCLSLPQCSALRYQLWSVVFAEENARVMHEHENKRYACCKTKKKHVVCRCMMMQ